MKGKSPNVSRTKQWTIKKRFLNSDCNHKYSGTGEFADFGRRSQSIAYPIATSHSTLCLKTGVILTTYDASTTDVFLGQS